MGCQIQNVGSCSSSAAHCDAGNAFENKNAAIAQGVNLVANGALKDLKPADAAANNHKNVKSDGSGFDYDSIPALTNHVNGILADGLPHGFPEGIRSYVPRLQAAVRHLQQAGIVTATDPFTAMQQSEKWLMANAGRDGVFSFGGGPANEDDAKALENKSGISREDINAVKFMFDDFHDAELSQKDSFLTVDRNNPVFQELAAVLKSGGLF